MEDTAALRERYQKSLDDILKTSELIAQKLSLLEAKEANWKALESKMKENAAQANEKIKLDVGGKTFCIAKSHLLSVEGSYFHAMLASGHWKPDSDGAYFIDRNPKHFDRVLDYLRTGELSYAGLRPDQIEALKKTLDYLQLAPVEPAHTLVSWDPNTCGNNLRLSEENRVITQTTTGWQSVQSLSSCVRYSVRFDANVGTADVMIGFAPKAGFASNTQTYTTCGWYLYTNGGTLYSQGGVSGQTYASLAIRVGSVVTCILDRERNNISFEVNGQSHGVAFTNIPPGEMCAAMNVHTASIQLTLVN